LLLLAVGAASPATRLQRDPSLYATVAAEYRTRDRAKALAEIRRWRPAELRAGIQALQKEADASHVVILDGGLTVKAPVEIDLRTAEAAALMHVEAGLLELQSLGAARAQSQLTAAWSLVEWSYAQKELRLRWQAVLRRYKVPEGDPDRELPPALKRALSIEPTIDKHTFDVALAAGALALGYPEAALPFAEKAKVEAPLDGEVLLVSACVKESLALKEKVRTRESEARRLRAEAETLFREAVAADPGQAEALLRLGSVWLDESRPHDAEPVLLQAVERARDDQQRYLALLFLGRAAELQEKPSDGAMFYRRALEAWPESQAARLALARCLERSAGPSAAQPLVMASLLDSRKEARERDPWWSYPFGPRGLAKAVLERLWQATLRRSFGS
jgi:tetratricopeptide (TPR) repeat protein